MNSLFQDWKANSGNTKGRLVLLLFRIAQAVSRSSYFTRIALSPYTVFYRLGVVWILGIELPLNGAVGPRLRLFHGQGLVVFDRVSIGSDVTLRHCTTIGAKHGGSGWEFPIIGDRVDIGSNCVVIGAVAIGDGAIVGAGAVVTKSVPSGAVAVGNPARELRGGFHG